VKAQFLGKAAALALLSVTLGSCGNPFAGDDRLVAREAAGGDERVRAFYEARGWRTAWNGDSRKALAEALDGAAEHGLNKELFLKGELPSGGGARDAALTRAALSYAAALARGYADPKRLGRIYTVPQPRTDVAAGLAAALQRKDLASWLGSLAPQSDEYRALSREFVRYLKLANTVEHGAVAAGTAIKPGQRDPRLPAIVQALIVQGYLGAREGPQPRLYSGPVVAAVTRAQADHGLKADGVIGKATLAILNRGPADRARQIAVNLERLRWLERDPPATRVDVNTAAAFLEYWRDGRPRDRRNVVVGQPDWETPELGSPMVRLVAHPYWRVPDSIYEDELADKSPAYLAEQGMEFRDGRLVQLPGPKNALGAVKFDLRNDQAIYLHDTPAKALFELPERHRSHGCVRVHDALGFALLIARDDGVLTDFQEALMEEDETFVKLRKAIPVRLTYRTAFLDNGAVRLVEDVYGWDDDVARALGYERPPRGPRRQVRNGDVGP